jgi:phosphatidylglycerol:prolipoprotein diacylglycerol transferase
MIAPTITVAGLTLHMYGLLIATGVFLAYTGMKRQAAQEGLLTPAQCATLTLFCIGAALIGGKLWYLGTTDEEVGLVAAFSGYGFAIAGATLSGMLALCAYGIYLRKPLLPIFALVASWACLAQGFGRLGCFFAGCCYGIPTQIAWCVTYTHAESLAPCNIAVHPVQLYSAAMLFSGFLIIQLLRRRLPHRPGIPIGAYLFFAGLERLAVAPWRASLGSSTATYSITLLYLTVGVIFFVTSLKDTGND